jgi:serine/threonine protein kinase
LNAQVGDTPLSLRFVVRAHTVSTAFQVKHVDDQRGRWSVDMEVTSNAAEVALLERLGLLELDELHFVAVLSGGRSAIAAVYEDPSSVRYVVKFLIAPAKSEAITQFQDEAAGLLQLSRIDEMAHGRDFVVRGITEVKQVSGLPVYYYLQEYVEGQTLASFLENAGGTVKWREAIDVLLRVACALSPISLLLRVHRDLHAKNILLLPDRKPDDLEDISEGDPRVRILDLGSSIWYPPIVYYPDQDREFRHRGAVITWSPESILDPTTAGPSHDVWSLGCLHYLSLVGEHPFRSASFVELMDKLLKAEYKLEPLRGLDIPEVGMHLIRRMLTVDPDRRIALGAVIKICWDTIYTSCSSVLAGNASLRRLYLDHDGDVWMCPNHYEIVSPIGERCPIQGEFVDEWLPAFGRPSS